MILQVNLVIPQADLGSHRRIWGLTGGFGVQSVDLGSHWRIWGPKGGGAGKGSGPCPGLSRFSSFLLLLLPPPPPPPLETPLAGAGRARGPSRLRGSLGHSRLGSRSSRTLPDTPEPHRTLRTLVPAQVS